MMLMNISIRKLLPVAVFAGAMAVQPTYSLAQADWCQKLNSVIEAYQTHFMTPLMGPEETRGISRTFKSRIQFEPMEECFLNEDLSLTPNMRHVFTCLSKFRSREAADTKLQEILAATQVCFRSEEPKTESANESYSWTVKLATRNDVIVRIKLVKLADYDWLLDYLTVEATW
jgi:hypothetical protein